MTTLSSTQRSMLFSACFVALVATAFAFMLRMMILPEWEAAFGLDETQKGTILGAGLWPFGVSIVLFSLIIDRIGYGKAMIFAFICHVAFALMTIFADGFSMLYWGSVIGALGAGTVEAVINPLIASIYRDNKTTWLNILHAGWPGGLVITGIVVLGISDAMTWQWKIGLILIPTVAYGIMMLLSTFPTSERVDAGIGYRAMLAEVGWGGAFIVALMIVMELTTNVLGIELLQSFGWQLGIAAVIAGIYGAYARSFGRPMYVFLLLIMLLLATTELGTDAWIKELLGPAINNSMGLDSGWALVYTAGIMVVLRLTCSPLIHSLKPLGVLAMSAALAAIGIYWLSILSAPGATVSATVIIIAATIYGLGQTFFWPTTLGFVAERFPRGGAMTLNVIAGVGMLGVGVLGAVWLGNVQDRAKVEALYQQDPGIHAKFVTEEKDSIFGSYTALTADTSMATPDELDIIALSSSHGKSTALARVAILPVIMFGCYIGLILYFRSKGGYTAVVLNTDETHST
ncbi:MAG: MFS transporter [Phycisphaerales bacterium]|nr:MFS transporter [Phycisphaerales bacterium]